MMRTSELTGALLDYWVARAEGYKPEQLRIRDVGRITGPFCVRVTPQAAIEIAYSRDWCQGGPLIEKYQLAVRPANRWAADNFTGYGDGDTPLQAICRAVVRAAFGDEVPDLAEGGA